MGRELIIAIYLFIFNLFFSLFKLSPLKDKITFVVSFSQNNLFVLNELKRRGYTTQIVFLSKPNVKLKAEQLVDVTVIPFETVNLINNLRGIYHLATSKTVFIDNYYGFLSTITFKDRVECIQLWHAAGAIKTFGLKDHSISERTPKAKERFKQVYNKFDKVVVGSNAMSQIFLEAFGISEDRILRTGIPRTDLFFDNELKENIIRDMFIRNKGLKGKKVILYAPTYRDGELDEFSLKLDLPKLYNSLSKDFVLLVKLHPAIKKQDDIEEMYPGFVFDYSLYEDINHLLLLTDYLVTDYSSIPYEFALLQKPMIFYPYDLEDYQLSRGLWGNYEEIVSGPIVRSTDELIEVIKMDEFEIIKISEFAEKWNEFSKGRSSQNIIDYLYEQGKVTKPHQG